MSVAYGDPGARLRPSLPAAPHAPPLTTRDCADYMGRSVDFVLKAIADGHLKAMLVQMPGRQRGRWVISESDFVAFLREIKWHHIPRA